MKKSSKIAFAVVSLALLIILLLILLKPTCVNTAKPSDWHHLPLVRIWNASQIANGIFLYQSDHDGHLPSHLIDLIPKYVSDTNVACFFPHGFDTNLYVGLIGNDLGGVIGRYGAFDYIGEVGLSKNLILYERQNFWPGETNMHFSTNDIRNLIVTIDASCAVKALSIGDVKRRLFEINAIPK